LHYNAGVACQYPLSTALAALALRLYDPLSQFWSQAELTLYVQEAIREWNAFTGYWRGDFTFPSRPGVVWYDLTDTTDLPATLRPLTVTDQQLFTEIEYHLLEPPVGAGPWTGSTQFSVQSILQAVQRRRDEALGVTGCFISRGTVPAIPGRTTIPQAIIDLRRLVYIDVNGVATVLWETDPQAWLGWEPAYTENPNGTPSTYSILTEPTWAFDVDRQPVLPGVYELLTVNSQAPLTPATASTLTVPDDWAWVVKWGALADLLGQQSEPRDSERQQYAETRYREGLALLSLAPSLMLMRIDNIPVFIDAVKSADGYAPAWETAAAGPPASVFTAGLNLLALSPPPDSGPYSMLATVVANAPIPSAPADCILLSLDLIDVILDEAQHLAAFKQGGQEFAATLPLHDRFMKQAAIQASKDSKQGPFQKALWSMSHKEEVFEPRHALADASATEAS
jgi:hypothetical protein